MTATPLRSLHRTRFCLAIATILALPSTPAFAQQVIDTPNTVQPAPIRFDIPAQPLPDALQAFARASRQQVSFDAGQLAGRRSQALHGDYASDDALHRLLEGSGVEAIRGRRGVWLVKPVHTPSSSAAQDPASLEAVVVTGTHIRDVAPTGSPVVVIDAEDIRRSGYSGTEQLLQALPQNFRGGDAGASADVNFSTGSQRGFNMTSGSGVNLRGLGANATLVLINGRRISASSGGTFTDISMIPLDAIERIEVLTDGASAVYGADAVGGVVNFILKSDYDSAETRLSYGATTRDGRDEYRVSHTMGQRWSNGGMLLTADYLDQSQLMASERAFTSNVPAPTTLMPSNKMASLVFSGEQALGDAFTLKGDLQYSRARRFSTTTSGIGRSDSDITPIRKNAALTLDYALSKDWNMSLDVFASEEEARSRLNAFRPNGDPDYDYLHIRTQEQRGTELKGSGKVAELPGGSVRLALGMAYKEEDYHRSIDLYRTNQHADRRNTSAFAEVHIPVIGESNARAGVHRLDLSLAARHDDYSDFGSTNNPRVGLSWSPTERLTVRSSYSTSFRAPAIGEEARFSSNGLVGAEISSFPIDAEGNQWVPVLMWLGSEPLTPEIARNRSVGIDWKPAFADGMSIALTYYDIRYTDRIVLPPLTMTALLDPALQGFVQRYDTPEQLRAVVDAAIADGVRLMDYTFGEFGDDPLSQTTTAFSYMWTNAARVDMRGFDLGVRYPFRHNDHFFDIGLDASYIHTTETRLNQTAPPYDVVGTFGNPPKWRARGSFSWTYLDLSSSLNVNFSDAYTDTTGLMERPVCAYTTVDLVTRYAFAPEVRGLLDGLSLSLNVVNLFDEQPPYITSSGRGAHYDPANASPLGRMVSLQVAKRW